GKRRVALQIVVPLQGPRRHQDDLRETGNTAVAGGEVIDPINFKQSRPGQTPNLKSRLPSSKIFPIATQPQSWRNRRPPSTQSMRRWHKIVRVCIQYAKQAEARPGVLRGC
ncbi:unnamed protein product, partial [Ectocarpus fasciculatus]